MSFFGFDASRHNAAAPGFSQAHDPFAGLSARHDEEEALDFEDTYDGLGDQLDETDDAFNDETFGGDTLPKTGAGKDFDFFGQTAKVANAIEEEHMRFNRHQPAPKAPAAPEQYPHAVSSSHYGSSQYGIGQYGAAAFGQPVRTGYEKYKEPEPELQVDAALWGVAPRKPAAPAPAQASVSSGRKVLSLEEVEAAMRAQSQTKKPTGAPQQPAQSQDFHGTVPAQGQYLGQQPAGWSNDYQFVQDNAQAPDAYPSHEPVQHPGHGHAHGHPVTILQRPQSKGAPSSNQQSQPIHSQPASQVRQQPLVQPTQILQNPNRLSGDVTKPGAAGYPSQPVHRTQGSFSNQAQNFVGQPAHFAHLSEEDKAVLLEQEAKRAKRNHKIWLLSKDNGVMTPHDKNFVTRIQLQQLVSATGNPNDHGTDESLNEDFYYQVHSQIRGSQRQHPSQPLNNFAQTYLYQTGSRNGGMRRHNRGPENHMQRMEQQVQRAVEAAKNKPKSKQLVIEGSLGKISFSNAKTPKPLLNIKRTESSGDAQRPGSAHRHAAPAHGIDKISVLRNIEKVYSTMLELEDHNRRMPPPLEDANDQELIESHAEWRETFDGLNRRLWQALKVHEPIGGTPIHPFIAFLSFQKGTKAIPRVFRLLTHEQRTTVFTIIAFHLDQLDVVRGALQDETGPNAAMREKMELFQHSVLNSLFNFMNDLDVDIIAGIMDLISSRNVDVIARSKIGASTLTMVLSRAELLKQSGGGNSASWQRWEASYNGFFNILEPTLPNLFSAPINAGEDMYVWQLLAALGIGASPEQQQKLVIAVKDRVMGTVALSKTLPKDLAALRLANVNLFMHSLGLDVELLQV